MVKKSSKLIEEIEVKKNHLDSPIKKPTTHEVKLKGGDNCNSELVFFVEDHERFKLEDLLRAKADLRSENFWSSLFKVSCDEFGETLRKISKVKHQNILPVVGYRSTNEEKLIIYKYQSNGSLLNLLNDYIARRKDFPWKLRLNIACGIARGLAFIYKKLDEGEANIIPHGNIKLSNILLNDKNEALIGEVFEKEVRENDHQDAFSLLNIALLCVSRSQENRPNVEEILNTIEGVMNAHEQQQQMELSASKCCSNGTNQECCSLHQIIPDTWDSPGSNY
ncbi:hypothetical protein P8452_44946 [Trifolium repens]|nr:hypothetical protein P8452_44942 [Trifolium repens]WJX59649.1 hypothetical protein P8452_44946 [Trifolium repens]